QLTRDLERGGAAEAVATNQVRPARPTDPDGVDKMRGQIFDALARRPAVETRRLKAEERLVGAELLGEPHETEDVAVVSRDGVERTAQTTLLNRHDSRVPRQVTSCAQEGPDLRLAVGERLAKIAGQHTERRVAPHPIPLEPHLHIERSKLCEQLDRRHSSISSRAPSATDTAAFAAAQRIASTASASSATVAALNNATSGISTSNAFRRPATTSAARR